MATPAQIAANRMDAASIVIPGEDPALYEQVAQNYYDEFRPASALEQFHVETIIRCDWQKRRLQRTEAKLYRALIAEGDDPDSPTARLLRKVFAQIASLERSLFRALSDLRRLKREQESPQNEPNSLPDPGLICVHPCSSVAIISSEPYTPPESPATVAHETPHALPCLPEGSTT